MLFARALLLVATVAAAKQGLRSTASHDASSNSLVCHLTKEFVSRAEDGVQRASHHHNECSLVEEGKISDYSFKIDLPSDFLDQNTEDLHAGKLFVSVPGGHIIDGVVIYPSSSRISVTSPPESFDMRHRRLTDTTGAKSLLVIRVSSNDAQPDFTADQFYNYAFDESHPDSAPSLASQYRRLSFGKLTFVPTQYGVMEVPVNLHANGGDVASIRDAAISYVTSRYGVSSMTDLADHVMFCIPPGTGNWAGTSSVMSWRIVMNNQWCGSLSGIMHEMGHNLGLLHANKDGAEYMDYTSYMSAGYQTAYYPMKSFNGANNAQLGWYSDRVLTVDPSQGGQMVTLATFVDYGKSNKNNPVLIQIGSSVFIQYNRAKDFNSQAQQLIDQATIVLKQNSGTSLLGGVDPATSPEYTITNLDGTGRNVVIHACAIGAGDGNNPDWITISISYDQNFCSQVGSPPAPPPVAPVAAPVAVPLSTATPTIAPAAAPVYVASPTIAPVPPPVTIAVETPSPTIAPAAAPVTIPVDTPSPTISTAAPIFVAVDTPSPTIAPTATPIAPSTLSPTISPATAPIVTSTISPTLAPTIDDPQEPTSQTDSPTPSPTISTEMPSSTEPSTVSPTLATDMPTSTPLPTPQPTRRHRKRRTAVPASS